MGFFSDLIDLTPNRSVAQDIKEYCSRTSLNNKESELIKNSKINEQQYIWSRNSINYCVFRCLIQAMNNKYPNTYWKITQSAVDEVSHDVFYSDWKVALFNDLKVPLPGTYGFWEDYFDGFCSSIEDKASEEMPSHVKERLRELTNEHQAEIIEFIKSRARKLTKPI